MSRPSNRLAPLLGFALLTTGLVIVFVTVLERRFASGDVYPFYSTSRSDPLGASALHESFSNLPGHEVTRNFRSLMSLDTLDSQSALWLCGLSRSSYNRMRGPDDSPILKAIRDDGARLILTINPELVPEKYDLKEKDDLEEWLDRREEARKESSAKEDKAEKETDNAEKSPGKEEEKDKKESEREKRQQELEASSGPLITKLFGANLDLPETFERPKEGWELKPGTPIDSERPIPQSLPMWRSQYRFTDLAKEWTVTATVDGKPVVIERAFGKGSVVMTSDSYFASDEALWQGAHSEFLLWLAGGKTRLVFDETIHGSVESGSVMKMVRQYRFHGFFIGFFVFIALLAWRSGTSLAPGSEAVERGLVADSAAAIAGEDTETGFIRLLRRNVSRKRLLRTCAEVWRQTAARRLRSESARQRQAVDTILAQHESSPKDLPAVDAYSRISSILAHPDLYRDTEETGKKPA
ncbi:MAG: hypothetical protein KDM64_02485 [Verrucomicrobiae bacterium]|nr:hypothetical protein [Verrucomicrobiae bacterium]